MEMFELRERIEDVEEAEDAARLMQELKRATQRICEEIEVIDYSKSGLCHMTSDTTATATANACARLTIHHT